jgi:hypothetical protein
MSRNEEEVQQIVEEPLLELATWVKGLKQGVEVLLRIFHRQ